jgi:hypothetical protein
MRLPEEINIPVLLLICFWLLLWALLGGCSATAVTKVEVRERQDSIIVQYDTIAIERPSTVVVAETIWASQTETVVRSVHARLDTAINGVHLKAEYKYPTDRWAVRILQRDTVIRWTVRDSIVQQPYEVETVPFWVYLALGGMFLALILALRK